MDPYIDEKQQISFALHQALVCTAIMGSLEGIGATTTALDCLASGA